MRFGIALVLLTTGCAGATQPGGTMTAIYVPPVRLGGTGSMMFLPAAPPPIDALPDARLLRRGVAVREGAIVLASEAACRERLDRIGRDADQRYGGGSGVWTLRHGDDVTLAVTGGPPTRTVRYTCDGARLLRENGTLPTPDVRPDDVPLPPIRTAPVER